MLRRFNVFQMAELKHKNVDKGNKYGNHFNTCQKKKMQLFKHRIYLPECMF
jgi:hypothetical protein